MILNQRITVRRWQYQNRVRKMRQSFYNYSELAETLRHETSLARDLGSSSTGGPPVPGISRALGRQFREIISLSEEAAPTKGGLRSDTLEQKTRTDSMAGCSFLSTYQEKECWLVLSCPDQLL